MGQNSVCDEPEAWRSWIHSPVIQGLYRVTVSSIALSADRVTASPQTAGFAAMAFGFSGGLILTSRLVGPARRHARVVAMAALALLLVPRAAAEGGELTIAFLPCGFHSIPGIAVVQGAVRGREWTPENIRAWIDDERIGLRQYLQQELLSRTDVSLRFSIGDWQAIGPPDRYLRLGGSVMESVHRDCAAAHAGLRPAEHDIVVMLTNYNLPFAGRGGGRRAILSSRVSPQTIVHEILHALVLPRLGLGGLRHSNAAGRDLDTLPLAWATAWSAMYGDGIHLRLLDDRYGVPARPLTTANRWMAGALPPTAERWLRAAGEETGLALWGAADNAEPLIALIPQPEGRIITVERQPTASRYSLEVGGFAAPPGSGFLLGVRYPAAVAPNNTDWAVVIDETRIDSGWILDEALVRPGETIRVGDATLSFSDRGVTLKALDR